MTEAYVRKQVMYSMVLAFEEDFIQTFLTKLTIEDINLEIITKAKANGCKTDNLESILRALDLHSYITISCANILKLGVKKHERDFLNNELQQIIPIRNRVMHPRLLEFYDFSRIQECFYKIEDHISFIDWKSIRKTKEILEKNPEKLPKFPYGLVKKPGVIDNIPEVTDFEDTSFIGRRTEINELKQLLFKKNINILTIVGDGGVGKTAIILKLLYELLDDTSIPYEVIIWVSLKTRTLQKFEFRDIDDAIKSIADINNKLKPFISFETPIEDAIIDISKSLKTIFILDNLETINTEEIKKFLYKLSEEAKIIITSRIGLGEMEFRYRLEGLNDRDVIEYFDVLLSLYGFEGRFSKDEKIRYAVSELHSNPLAIKWFVMGLAENLSPQKLIEKKVDVISYCMSNVYEKLSELSKKILKIVCIICDDLKYAELLFYLECTSSEDVAIRNSINELIKSNFLDRQKFSDFLISLTAFSREYMKKIVDISGDMKNFIHTRYQKLSSFTQSMQVRVRTSNLINVYCFKFDLEQKEKCIAAYYLNEALKCSRYDYARAMDFIDLAELIAPNYFEVNKVKGFLLNASSPMQAKAEYLAAIQKADSIDEEIKTQTLFACFLIRNNDYTNAMKILEYVLSDLAPKTKIPTIDIKLELVKAKSSCGLFDEAQILINEISCEESLAIRHQNIILTRKADILKRRFEALLNRSQLENYHLLTDAMQILRQSNSPDSDLLNSEADILSRLSYFLFNDEVVDFIVLTLNEVYNQIWKTKSYKKFITVAMSRLNQITSPEKKNLLKPYLIDIFDNVNLLNDNRGVVYKVDKTQGFAYFKNKDHSSVYFRINYEIPCSVGSIIEFDEIYLIQGKGPMISKYTIVGHASDIETIKSINSLC